MSDPVGTAAAAAAAFAATNLDDVVALLGLVPLGLGIAGLLALRRGTEDGEGPPPPVRGIVGVAAVTIAGGADNVAVYVPFLANRGSGDPGAVLITFAVLLGVWLTGARWLAGRPPVARTVGRWGHVAVPVVLVVLGAAILAEGLA
ncbi:cadmium resistance transporter [Patulibacter sp. NPDC049589]|uniref:cadmium resistance transporter n=1 Tax=Patulibacter sp. NPDC049589 TaxID=3154731 RepID=UPI00342458C3